MRRAVHAAAAAATLLLCTGTASGEDAERAAYLAGTCATCHHGGDATATIPGLAGRSPDDFLAAMRAFRGGERPSPIMAAVAKSLSDAELDLLARHFGAERAP